MRKGIRDKTSYCRENLLTAVAESIEKEYGVQSKVIVQDLSEDNAIERIYDDTSELDIGFVTYVACLSSFGRFETIPEEFVLKQIQTNVIALTKATHKDIAIALATTFAIVGVSQLIANFVVSLNPPTIIAQTFGSIYLIMTLITAILATVFAKFFGNIRGAMELGNVGLLAWFFTIGCSGNIVEIVKGSALSLGILVIMQIFNLSFSIIGAKLIKGTWEDAVCASTATVGGPPTAAAVTIAFNWSELVVPGILVGLWGYIVGNYFGIIAGNIIGVPSLF